MSMKEEERRKKQEILMDEVEKFGNEGQEGKGW